MAKLSEIKNPELWRLAIDGGKPAFTTPLPAWPITDEAIEDVLSKALRDGTWGTYDGPWIERLHHQLSEMFQCDFVHSCSSGTIAVEMALRGVGVQAGDEVILAGYDFPGNFRAIEAIEALPVLVDAIPNGWVINASTISQAIGPKTRAIVVSHLHGQIADIQTIRQKLNEAADQPVAIVEDVCQMPGGSLAGRPLGTFGDISVLSFGGSKLISAGRGGAVLTNDSSIAQRVKINNERGNQAYPLSQLQAAVLLPQLDALPARNETRQTRVARLLDSLEAMTTATLLQQIVVQDFQPAYFKLPFLLSQDCRWTREQWLVAAQREGVPLAAGFRGFANRSSRRCRQPCELTNSKIAADRTMLLHHPILLAEPERIDEVALGLLKVDHANHPKKPL